MKNEMSHRLKSADDSCGYDLLASFESIFVGNSAEPYLYWVEDWVVLRTSYLRASLAAKAQAAMTKRILKTAEPTMVPIPTSFLAMKTPMTEVKSSGAEPPAAIKVAPATSGLTPNCKVAKKDTFTNRILSKASLNFFFVLLANFYWFDRIECSKKEKPVNKTLKSKESPTDLPCQRLSLFNQSIPVESTLLLFPKRIIDLYFLLHQPRKRSERKKESILDTSQQHSFTEQQSNIAEPFFWRTAWLEPWSCPKAWGTPKLASASSGQQKLCL